MTSPTTAPRRSRPPKLDAIAAEAVELAREALLEVTEPGQVGEHLRVEASGERLVTHVFECTMPGYRGWSWVVVLARASRAKAATVAESALLPGDEAILAPEWEPWSQRLRPSDVGADDLLPYQEQDERLEQGYEPTGDEDEDRVALWELGLGRARVLSREGRTEAVERWREGEFGPRQISGRGRRGTVAASCSSCGFLMKLAGSLRQEFGVCANEWSPADGRVVHLNYGCGAHSETGQQDGDREISRSTGVVVDELDVELQQDEPAKDASGKDASAQNGKDASVRDGKDALAQDGKDASTQDGKDASARDEQVERAPAQDEPAAAEARGDEAPVGDEAPARTAAEPDAAAPPESPAAEHHSPMLEIPEADSPED